MSDDLADDLQSLSFGSSGRSAATTDTTTTTTTASFSSSGSAPTSGPISASAGAALGSSSSSAGNANGGCYSTSSSSSSCCCSCSSSISRPDIQGKLTSPPLRISDLRFLRRIGSGDIGTVYLAQIKADNSSFHDGLLCRFCGGTTARPPPEQHPPQTPPRLLAAKVMDREELRGRNKQGRARAELEILKMLDHPFLPKLLAFVQDDRWACLLTDFCPGGDLHVLRQRQPQKRFTEAAVRFYAAEVVVALEYLHMLGVVYRDLKPENVLVRADGHIMLTDFDLSLRCDDSASTPRLLGLQQSAGGTQTLNAAVLLPPQTTTSSTGGGGLSTSCILPAVSCFNSPYRRTSKSKTTTSKSNKGCYHHHSSSTAAGLEFVAEPVGARSMSFVGTHEYLAPEIVSGEGHGSAVDWWTLGVLLFELLYGYTPFRGADNDMTLANIVARALEFPKESSTGSGGRKADTRKGGRWRPDAGDSDFCGPPVVSHHAKDLITGLLVKDPDRRIGSATGAAAVKRHPFFHGVNWALLRCAKPPLIPPPLPNSFFDVNTTAATSLSSSSDARHRDDDHGSCCDDDGDGGDHHVHRQSSDGSIIDNTCSSSAVARHHNNASHAPTKGDVLTMALVDASPEGSPVHFY